MRPGVRLHVLTVLLVLALLATGCGGDDENTTATGDGAGTAQTGSAAPREFGAQAGGSAARQARATLRGYLDARAKEEWARACSYATKDVRRLYGQFARRADEIQGHTCAAFLRAAANRSASSEQVDLASLRIGEVRVAGGKGFVLYAEPGKKLAMPISTEGDIWKLAGLEGVPAEK